MQDFCGLWQTRRQLGATMKSLYRRPLALATTLLLAATLATAQSGRHVDQERLRATLEKLSEFGRPAGAGFDGGVTRVAFSQADLAAR